MIDAAYLKRQSNVEDWITCVLDGLRVHSPVLGHRHDLRWMPDLAKVDYPPDDGASREAVRGLSGWWMNLWIAVPPGSLRGAVGGWITNTLVAAGLILWRADIWTEHRVRIVLMIPETHFTNLAVMRRLLDADKHDRDHAR